MRFAMGRQGGARAVIGLLSRPPHPAQHLLRR